MEATNAALNSRGSKLRNSYRDLYRDVRFRVKHPIAQTIKSLTPHLSYSYWIKHSEQRLNAARIAEAISEVQVHPKNLHSDAGLRHASQFLGFGDSIRAEATLRELGALHLRRR